MRATTNNCIELAVQERGGSWELIDDYETVPEAKTAALLIARRGYHFIDDNDVMKFGISVDPDSGNYEETFCVDTSTGESWSY